MPSGELHVAAASNLIRIFPEIARAFEQQTGIRAIPGFGSTAQLARQIENGAPIDVFMAADTAHVPESRRVIYARGRLIAWAPHNFIHDLTSQDIRSIAIAKPELAPYGAAAVAALKTAGVWGRLEQKIVYAPSISAAKQLADTGNVDVAITAMSLTVGQSGNSFPIDPAWYPPIDQAACITPQAQNKAAAARFLDLLQSASVRAIFQRHGYN